MAYNEVQSLNSIIQRRMARKPNLRPKTRFGQHTISRDPNIQYEELKNEYRGNATATAKLQPLIKYLGDRILTDGGLLQGDEGIYTWILKRGHLYATRLISNQEIGTLHANLDILKLNRNNVKNINHNTLKNKRTSDNLPKWAGELLLVKDEYGVRLYFNLQSGTYTEPKMKCRVALLVTERGFKKKTTKNKKTKENEMMRLKMVCRDEMVGNVQEELASATGLSLDKVRFLSCDEDIQKELEAISFLSKHYTHGACRDDEEYNENVAGRNLIRRFMAYTSPDNQKWFQTYFKPANAPLLGKRKGMNNQKRNNTLKIPKLT